MTTSLGEPSSLYTQNRCRGPAFTDAVKHMPPLEHRIGGLFLATLSGVAGASVPSAQVSEGERGHRATGRLEE